MSFNTLTVEPEGWLQTRLLSTTALEIYICTDSQGAFLKGTVRYAPTRAREVVCKFESLQFYSKDDIPWLQDRMEKLGASWRIRWAIARCLRGQELLPQHTEYYSNKDIDGWYTVRMHDGEEFGPYVTRKQGCKVIQKAIKEGKINPADFFRIAEKFPLSLE